MNFTDYQKAHQILLEKEIEEAISFIPKILNLCIKKGLDFSLNTDSKVIEARNLTTGFVLTGYYDADLVDYSNEKLNTFKIKDIYEKLKGYKKTV